MIKKKIDLEDCFLMSEIIDKTGIDANVNAINDAVKQSTLETTKDAAKIGKQAMLALSVTLFTDLIKKIHKAKAEIYQLIGNLTEQTPEEVKTMGLKDIKNFFTELASQEEFSDFLESAAQEEK